MILFEVQPESTNEIKIVMGIVILIANPILNRQACHSGSRPIQSRIVPQTRCNKKGFIRAWPRLKKPKNRIKIPNRKPKDTNLQCQLTSNWLDSAMT